MRARATLSRVADKHFYMRACVTLNSALAVSFAQADTFHHSRLAKKAFQPVSSRAEKRKHV
jgi:hypothetical protein